MGLAKKIGIWYAARAYRDGIAGKKGKAVKNILLKLTGIRSAVMALVLLAEVVCRQIGLETGPVFGILRGLFGAMGWESADGQALLGVPPETLVTAALTIWFAAVRIFAWAKGEPKLTPTPAK